jgi:hypothetical protein
MKKKALLLMLFFMFISTNALAQNVIWGYVTGDKIGDVKVQVYEFNCGAIQQYAGTTTNFLGQYGIGYLEAGRYLVVPDADGYSFSPYFRWVEIITDADEHGNVNFVSEITCERKCDQLFDYCMDTASAWWMNCTFTGGNNCAADDWLHTETCKNDKESCQDQCDWY